MSGLWFLPATPFLLENGGIMNSWEIDANDKEIGSVFYTGITSICDRALWKMSPYSDESILVLLSLYGSESQLRGIFSAIAQRYEITLKKGEKEIQLMRQWDGSLSYKSSKIGFGKYHAVIWDSTLLSECVVMTKNQEEIEAWTGFLEKRRIPFLKEWISPLVEILLREELIEPLDSMGLKGWHFQTSDEEVCNLIVSEIYTEKRTWEDNQSMVEAILR